MSCSIWKRGLIIFSLMFAILAGNTRTAQASTATVGATGYQQVKGWGSFPSYFRTDWSTTHQFDIFNKPAVQDAIYAMGLTHIRVDVEPRLYVSGTQLSDIVLDTASLNDLVNQIQIARNHGVTQYIMSCWSPPAVWKDNGNINQGHLIPADEPFFVNYYTKVIQTLNARGVGLPVAISVQNEPDTAPNYDSCIYSDTQANINLWYQLVIDMKNSFNANGCSSVAVFGPECTNTDNDNMFLGRDNYPILSSNTALNTAMGAYATHGYGECYWLPNQSGMAAHPKDSWITEWSIYNSQFGTTESDYTMATMRHMNSNFVDLPFNYWTAWIEWTLDGSYVGGDQTPTYSERYWILQKLWTTVKPSGNWIVHKMTCDDGNYITSNSSNISWPPPISCDTMVDLVDYRKGDSTQDCVVLCNNTTGTTTTMAVNGLIGSTYTAYMSDATHDMVVNGSGSVASGSCTVSLPPKSVTILITGGGAPTVPAAPTNLTATPGSGQISLNWNASGGATTYNVSRSTASGSGYASVATGLAATTYTNTGLTNGTTYYFVATATNTAGTSGNSAQASAAPSATIKINCGGSTVSPFAADAFFTGGTSGNNWTGTVDTSAVTNPAPQAVYQTEHYGDFTYTFSGFTVGASSTVRLHFTEDYVTAAGQRIFNVAINGTNVLTNFDIFAAAGAQHKANIQQFTAVANASGQYVIQFTSVTNNAKVDAIEILPASTPPATPTGLAATAGNAQAVLNWSAASGATSYNVYRGTAAGGESATAIATSIAGTTYTNTGLTNGTTYYYKVAAVNASGTSTQSNEASAVPFIAAPPAPTGLAAVAGNAQVALTWTASSGASSYNVKRSTVSGSGYATVSSPAATNYTNTGLTNGTLYYFVVSAVNGGGESANSTQVSATPVSGVPSAPTGLAASAGSTQITLTWTASLNTTSYNLYRGTTAGGEGTTALVTGIAATSYTNTGLTNGTTYYYKVAAVNGSGTSAQSGEASAIPQTSTSINAGGPATGAFAADIDFSGGNTATNWTGTIDTTGLTNPAPQAVYQSERYGTMTYTVPGLTASGAYKVRLHFCENYFTASGGRTFNVTVGGTQVLTNFDIFATTGAAHKATIKEFNTTANAGGQVVVTLTTVVNNALLNAIEVQPIAGTPPAAPTSLTATPGNAQVTLNWTASTGATSYNVYRGSTAGGEGVAPVATGIASTSYICTGETNGTTYFFKVTAANIAGESGNSNEASAAPQAPPAAPTNLIATAGNTQVAVSWSAATGATTYNVKRSTVSGSGYATVASPTTTSYVNTGLTNGTTYYYVVTGLNIGGESANSTQASATPTSGTGGGTTISVDFTGGSTTNGNPASMGTSESAGVIAADHWNSAAGAASVSALALTDNAGGASGATVAWTSNNTWSTAITETAGNARMMKGYLDTSNTSTSSVTVSTLPSTYTTNGYDVYVYCDGDTSTATRTGTYTIGSTTISSTDNAGADFAGTFNLGNGTSGNYVKFSNQTAASFTLSATPGASSDGFPRAPINGIQIVSHSPSTNMHSGTWACKAAVGASPSYTKISEVVSVAANTNYVASYWIKGTGTLELCVLNGSWGTSITPNIDTAATGAWQQITTPVFNTGSDTQITFIIQDFVGGAAGNVYIDDTFLGVSGGSNMLNNPGFESGNTGWNVSGVFSILQNP